MTRTRGWHTRGQALVAKVPHGHWKTLTFLAALRKAENQRVWRRRRIGPLADLSYRDAALVKNRSVPWSGRPLRGPLGARSSCHRQSRINTTHQSQRGIAARRYRPLMLEFHLTEACPAAGPTESLTKSFRSYAGNRTCMADPRLGLLNMVLSASRSRNSSRHRCLCLCTPHRSDAVSSLVRRPPRSNRCGQ
jgi:hypothetical protein